MDSEKMFQTQGMMSARAPRSGGLGTFVFIIFIGLLLAGGAFGMWAKKMTDPVAPPQRTAELLIAHGTVHVQGSDESVSRVAKSGDVLAQGMIITTDADTEAELHFYDASVARLAPETEITLTTLAHDANKPTEDKVGITVEIGRVWSRVLNLLSLNAEFTVKSSTTVATVRGTAFDFSVKKDAQGVRWTHVNGADSIVDCAAKKWNGIVKKGEWLHVPDTDPNSVIAPSDVLKTFSAANQKSFTEKGVVLGDVMPEAVDAAWKTNNTSDDTRFLQDQKDKRKREENSLVKPFAMPVIGGVLEKIAEKRLDAATGAQRDAMLATWAERHIALANQSAEAGNSDAALQMMDRVKAKVESVDVKTAGDVQQHIDEAIGRGDAATELGDKLITHMPELKGASDQSARELMKSVLLENRLRGIEEDSGTGETPASIPDQVKAIDSNLFDPTTLKNPILKQRFEYLRERKLEMSSSVEPKVVAPPVEGGVAEPVGKPIEPIIQKPLVPGTVKPVPLPLPIIKPGLLPLPAPAPAPTPAPAPLPQPKIIIDGPTSIQADQAADFTATLVDANGTRRDVTKDGNWSVVGNGSIAGGHYQAVMHAGTDYIVFQMKAADGSDVGAKKALLVEPTLELIP